MTNASSQPVLNKTREQVRNMFDNIAPRYDLLNHTLSFGIDRLWRRRLVREAGKIYPAFILDVATGTADLALALAQLHPMKIIGVDISEQMLNLGKKKVSKKQLAHMIDLQIADSENLPFASESFDLATVSFGVRNFENLNQGLAELNRVVKSGGMVAILEFSMPQKFPVKQFYRFYFRNVLPFIGRLISQNKKAYTYLPDSVGQFPYGEDFARCLLQAGFSEVRYYPLTQGIATLYISTK